MKSVVELMCAHRSIRQFAEQPISPGQLEQILLAAQSASSSSFLQAVSVIRVKDMAKRHQLVRLCGEQAYVASAAEFLVFCIDFHRHRTLVPAAKTGYIEQLLIGAIDAGLMGQNALLAAESMGLGGVFIGAIRNDPEGVSQLLGLPELVVPLFGLCLGYPAQSPDLKPRLPLQLVLHEEQYQAPDPCQFAAYDALLAHYYRGRGEMQGRGWTDQLEKILSKEARPFMFDYLKRRGFALK
ncbi:MAG: oxygen-insensitive NADPH nitroreductase [Aeromonadaceae bacterium]|nr:oxygen-insensitive NADPH nitroreductase [Aeromonadaceae bacterium]